MNKSILYTILLILLLLVINIVLFIKIDEVNKKITLALIVILAFVIVLNPLTENYLDIDQPKGIKGVNAVRIIGNPGQYLSLAEVEVYSIVNGKEVNVALDGTAKQSSEGWFGKAGYAIDGHTVGHYGRGKNRGEKGVTHSGRGDRNPWWEVALDRIYNVTKIVIYNRTDCCQLRINNSQIMLKSEVGEAIATIPYGNWNVKDSDFDITTSKNIEFKIKTTVSENKKTFEFIEKTQSLTHDRHIHLSPSNLVKGLLGLLPKGMYMNNDGDTILEEPGQICILDRNPDGQKKKTCYDRNGLIGTERPAIYVHGHTLNKINKLDSA